MPVLTGHLVARHVCLFARAALSLLTGSAALCFATLASLVRSIHGLINSLRSLPRGTVEIHECVHAENAFYGSKRIFCGYWKRALSVSHFNLSPLDSIVIQFGAEN